MSLVIEFDQFGGPEVLHATDIPTTDPQEGEVRVRLEAFAVNALDVMMRSGRSPAPVPLPHAHLGIEGTGIIDATGPGASRFAVGDAVILAALPTPAAHGSYAQHVAVPTGAVIPRPAGLSAVEAAASWVAYSTAYGALVERAGLSDGDALLIAGASSSVGRAALQLARRLGAAPLAITRDATKTAELLAAGADRVILAAGDDLAQTVRQSTDGRGADITLDLVRGPGQGALLDATRTGGTLVAAGFLDPRLTPAPADDRVAVVNYRSFDDVLNPVVLQRMSDYLAPALADGSLRPSIDTVFTVDQVIDAHRRFEQGLHAGRKIVVTV